MGIPNEMVIAKLKRITLISLVFMSVEIAGGLLSNSLAVLADAFHLLSDVLAYVISLIALLMVSKKAPDHLSFGYEKLQPLGALLNVLIIWFVTFELFIEATKRILNQQPVQNPFYMLATAIFGLLCNLYIMKVLHNDDHVSCSHNHSHSHSSLHQTIKQNHHSNNECSHQHHQNPLSHKILVINDNQQNSPNQCFQKQPPNSSQYLSQNSKANNSSQIDFKNPFQTQQSPKHNSNINTIQIKGQSVRQNINIQAAYIHILSDIILSIGVIISATIIYLFAPQGWSNWQLVDPFCTYFFSIMAIFTTIPVFKESIVFLLDGCNEPTLPSLIRKQIASIDSNIKIIDFKVWSINRDKHIAAITVANAHNQHIESIRSFCHAHQCYLTIQQFNSNHFSL